MATLEAALYRGESVPFAAACCYTYRATTGVDPTTAAEARKSTTFAVANVVGAIATLCTRASTQSTTGGAWRQAVAGRNGRNWTQNSGLADRTCCRQLTRLRYCGLTSRWTRRRPASRYIQLARLPRAGLRGSTAGRWADRVSECQSAISELVESEYDERSS